MRQHLQRAALLVEQRKFAQAVEELRQQLVETPEDGTAHAMLAICLSEMKKYDEATREAQAAVGAEPDYAYAYYALSFVMRDRRRLKEAQAAVQEALRLDPHHPSYWSMMASIAYAQSRWQESLEAAQKGLEVEPSHVACTNFRTMALMKLGRRAEAKDALGDALSSSPDNPVTHANQGWARLEEGDHRAALESFREALRLDPESEWARAGIVEAMKARNILYRPLLKYFLWTSRLSGGAQWGIVIGLYVVARVLRGAARQNEDLAPIILPVLGVYLLFVFSTWLASPLFNLLLRLDRFGRYALSRDQTLASNWIGASLAGAVLLGVASAITGASALLVGAVSLLLLTLPLSAVFSCDPGWPRRTMASLTAALAVLALAAAVSAFRQSSLFIPLAVGVLAGAIVSTWVGNALTHATAKK